MQADALVPVVRREKGQRKEIMVKGEDLLPEDVVFLRSRDRVPADMRILWGIDGMEVSPPTLLWMGWNWPGSTTSCNPLQGSAQNSTSSGGQPIAGFCAELHIVWRRFMHWAPRGTGGLPLVKLPRGTG